ncbi:YdaS family helix-turn-helix protein [Candidatus Contendibacter odensensis]|uniref:Cro/Cl family transcriptional regulator n=1 Tax=Candidatus Contendobacter odensis Run_B_J11 TaxID=1400861 RepID=A0A7U7GF46_9GAMM|nr:YdaS family helix-turn-helix protein [Candidatus Contendobacter odensis]CDH46979.1 hypothetical protein BN874_690029 [Candidatus Contendobacter odensis Run_B_J11]
MNDIQRAIHIIGTNRLAKACRVKHPSVNKWGKAGRLPRTEWTGETRYAEVIEQLSEGRVTVKELLRLPHRPPR